MGTLAAYQMLFQLTEEMAKAADAGMWEQFVALESARSAVLPACRITEATSPDEAPRIVEIIHKINAIDAVAVEKIEVLQAHTRILLRMNTAKADSAA